MLSDLVRSTDLIQQLGDERSAAIFDRHDRLARDLIARHLGAEIDKSDGFLVLFEDPASAVGFAIDYHTALARLCDEVDIPVTGRVGIHTGEVLLRRNRREDIERGAKPLEVNGLAKPLAARLMSLAAGGQTLLTLSAVEAARPEASCRGAGDGELQWLDHGEYKVQGLIDPITVYEVGLSGLAPLRPPPDSKKVRRVAPDAAPRTPAIAVLPFTVLPQDASDDFLGLGITDELIADLAQVKALRVFARDPTQQLRDPATLLELRERHHLRYLLEGTVRRSGTRIRITVKLYETGIEELLWAAKYSGDTEEIFDLQDALSQDIVEALELEISREEREGILARPIPDVRAYEYYLKAKAEITRFREDSLETAIDHLGQGMKILGEDNILLRSALGYAYWQYYNTGATSDAGYLDKAHACALQILEQQPRSVHGHRLLALVSTHRRDLQKSVDHLKMALETDPEDADALLWLSLILGFVGRPAAAFLLAERLLEVDPLTPFHNCLPGWLMLMQGDFDLAPAHLERAWNMDPGNPLLAYCYGHSLALTQRPEEACAVFDKIVEAMPDNFHAPLVTLFAAALRGDVRTTKACLTPELTEPARGDWQYSWNLAEYLALVGERESALDWLENAVDLGFLGYPLFSKLDPFLEPLRGEPRFEDLMTRLKPLWTNFRA